MGRPTRQLDGRPCQARTEKSQVSARILALKQLPRHHHSLDLVGALVDLGDLRGHGKGHRYSRTGPPIALRIGVLMPCPVPGRTDQRLPRRPGLVSQRQGVLLAGNVKDNLRLPRFDGPCCCIGSPALAARTGLRSLAPSPHQVLRGCAVRPGRLAAEQVACGSPALAGLCVTAGTLSAQPLSGHPFSRRKRSTSLLFGLSSVSW
jgi:hypothetical protein